MNLGQVEVGSNIAQNHIAHRKSYLVIICPNAHATLPPKFKLGKVGVDSNIAQNHSLTHMKPYLVIHGCVILRLYLKGLE